MYRFSQQILISVILIVLCTCPVSAQVCCPDLPILPTGLCSGYYFCEDYGLINGTMVLTAVGTCGSSFQIVNAVCGAAYCKGTRIDIPMGQYLRCTGGACTYEQCVCKSCQYLMIYELSSTDGCLKYSQIITRDSQFPGVYGYSSVGDSSFYEKFNSGLVDGNSRTHQYPDLENATDWKTYNCNPCYSCACDPGIKSSDGSSPFNACSQNEIPEFLELNEGVWPEPVETEYENLDPLEFDLPESPGELPLVDLDVPEIGDTDSVTLTKILNNITETHKTTEFIAEETRKGTANDAKNQDILKGLIAQVQGVRSDIRIQTAAITQKIEKSNQKLADISDGVKNSIEKLDTISNSLQGDTPIMPNVNVTGDDFSIQPDNGPLSVYNSLLSAYSVEISNISCSASVEVFGRIINFSICPYRDHFQMMGVFLLAFTYICCVFKTFTG